MCSKQAEVCRTGKPVRRSYNKTHINNLEKLHAGAGRIVYGLPWDTANLMGRFGNNEQRTTNKEDRANALKEFKHCLAKFDTDNMNFEPILATTKNRDFGNKYF